MAAADQLLVIHRNICKATFYTKVLIEPQYRIRGSFALTDFENENRLTEECADMNTNAALSAILPLLVLLPSSSARFDYPVEVDCGKYTKHDGKVIVNGVEVKSEVSPWHVLIYFKEKNMTYIQICSGSLINDNFVISVHQCFYDEDSKSAKDASNLVVAAGKRYRAWDADEQYSQKSLVESIVVSDIFSDIALLKLKTPLELNMLVRPICIHWENDVGDMVLQRGLGKMVVWNKNINDQHNQTMYEVDMMYMSRRQCVAKSPVDLSQFTKFGIRWDRYCARRLNDSNVCNEDGGSGLYEQIGEDWYLHGVVQMSDKYGNIDRCAYNNSFVGFSIIGHSVHHMVRDLKGTYT
ncbi:modular serine protease-like [Harpegnathos saltator]|uniref:modular serine protease-like n=1 Tax=Harpegnathos saltator TaxID=610380 RepID=UPI00058FD34E|nr:modular serine protease-like [Harpegnathos saltator]XP_025153724.1 modular serine protease-like [Harpegnathos saltator]